MDKYGLIGRSLKHSFSYQYFGDKFKNEKIDSQYDNYELESIEEVIPLIENEAEIKGLNVTIPYKEQIIPYLDRLDSTAQKIGAVNVIKIIRTQSSIELVGYNTDIIGFQQSIFPLINKEIHNKALILGTGGAAKAVYFGMENLGMEATYVSRTPKEGNFTYSELSDEIIKEHSIIVNASPVGTYPNVDNCPDIPYKTLTPNHILYDLVYNPPLTKFLKMGKKQGTTIKNGYEMLERQALAAWDIWQSQSV